MPWSIRASGRSMPEAATQSPGAMALQRFWRAPSVRYATWALIALVLLAVYAPLLASEVAPVWVGGQGLRLPLVADLFNRGTYERPHDLLFNILALLLPFLVAGWWLLRRRWTTGRRLSGGIAVVVLAWFAAMTPLPQGGGWRALWDYRPGSPHTSTALAELEAHGSATQAAPFAILPPIPHRVG